MARGPSKILVADDDEAIRKLLTAVLEMEGYTVVAAKDGIEALALLAEERPDLMTLDILMPRLDGRDVLRRMRELPDVAQTRVLVVSSMDRSELGDWPVSGFLTKPFDLDILLATVRRILASGRCPEGVVSKGGNAGPTDISLPTGPDPAPSRLRA